MNGYCIIEIKWVRLHCFMQRYLFFLHNKGKFTIVFIVLGSYKLKFTLHMHPVTKAEINIFIGPLRLIMNMCGQFKHYNLSLNPNLCVLGIRLMTFHDWYVRYVLLIHCQTLMVSHVLFILVILFQPNIKTVYTDTSLQVFDLILC